MGMRNVSTFVSSSVRMCAAHESGANAIYHKVEPTVTAAQGLVEIANDDKDDVSGRKPIVRVTRGGKGRGC
jgi:hypothetical protein